jgi:hypothetical protein
LRRGAITWHWSLFAKLQNLTISYINV